MDLMLIKLNNGLFQPATEQDVEVARGLTVGQEYGCTLNQLRKGRFHRKVFALLKFMYDQLPRKIVEYQGAELEQSFETFRKECLVLAGHYIPIVTRAGEIRLEPISISYKTCTQAEIEQIYSDLIDLALRTLSGYPDRDDLNRVVEQLMEFA